MENAAIFVTGTAIPISHSTAGSALLRALWDSVQRSAKGVRQHRRRRFLFPPGRGSRCEAKIGGMISLWPLGTLWLACFAAPGMASNDAPLKCEDLRIGQYICEDPKIDNATQEPMKCTNHTAYVACLPAPNITCKDFNGNETQFTGNEIGFYQPIECRSVNGYSYKVAVALSLFLGWLGADRFYLGYPALGLLKFCTVGFCGIGSLIDFILISMQIVGPSDGSNYIIDYYGARLTRLTITNDTYRKPQMYP